MLKVDVAKTSEDYSSSCETAGGGRHSDAFQRAKSGKL